jgi:integrase
LAVRLSGDPEAFLFRVETRPQWGRKVSVCRDDRDILQHFLRPAAVALGLYYPGFGFHAFRREAVTETADLLGIGQAMKLAGHSSADISLLYTLDDHDRQASAVKIRQERLRGKVGNA